MSSIYLSLNHKHVLTVHNCSNQRVVTMNSNAVTVHASRLSTSVIDATTVKTDRMNEIAKLRLDVVPVNSVATPANVSAKAGNVIVTSTAETEAMKTAVVSVHKSYFNRTQKSSLLRS